MSMAGGGFDTKTEGPKNSTKRPEERKAKKERNGD